MGNLRYATFELPYYKLSLKMLFTFENIHKLMNSMKIGADYICSCIDNYERYNLGIQNFITFSFIVGIFLGKISISYSIDKYKTIVVSVVQYST